jgi:hypothetical protein
VLWKRRETVGLHYQGAGSCFQSIDAPADVEVTVFVEFTSKICKFCRNGIVVAIQSVPEAEFPLRLGVCGHNGSTFSIKPDKITSLECLMAAQVGDSIFRAMHPSNQQVALFPSLQQPRAPSSAFGKGAAVGGFSAASEKSVKQLECMRLEFSSTLEFDLWRRALVHTHPSLIVDSTQSLQSFEVKQEVQLAETNTQELDLLFSFVPDTRCLCEERYVLVTIHTISPHSFFKAAMCVWIEFGLHKVCCYLMFATMRHISMGCSTILTHIRAL